MSSSSLPGARRRTRMVVGLGRGVYGDVEWEDMVAAASAGYARKRDTVEASPVLPEVERLELVEGDLPRTTLAPLLSCRRLPRTLGSRSRVSSAEVTHAPLPRLIQPQGVGRAASMLRCSRLAPASSPIAPASAAMSDAPDTAMMETDPSWAPRAIITPCTPSSGTLCATCRTAVEWGCDPTRKDGDKFKTNEYHPSFDALQAAAKHCHLCRAALHGGFLGKSHHERNPNHGTRTAGDREHYDLDVHHAGGITRIKWRESYNYSRFSGWGGTETFCFVPPTSES